MNDNQKRSLLVCICGVLFVIASLSQEITNLITTLLAFAIALVADFLCYVAIQTENKRKNCAQNEKGDTSNEVKEIIPVFWDKRRNRRSKEKKRGSRQRKEQP